MRREQANDWLERNSKAPLRLELREAGCGVGWRWTEPDIGHDTRPEELPVETFRALRGDPKFPWIFRTEESARSGAIEAIVATFAPCPACRATGGGVVHVYGERDGMRFGEWRHQPCSTCQGIGHVPPHVRDRIAVGQRLQADRKARGLSLREEAARLGITPKALSDREHGRA